MFTTKFTNEIHDECEAALQDIAKKYSIEIKQFGGTMKSDAEVVLKFRFQSKNEETLRSAFAKHAKFYYCKPDDFGRRATVNRREVELIGFELERRKYPIKLRDVETGKVSLFTREVLGKHFHTGDYHEPVNLTTKVEMVEFKPRQGGAS